MKNRIRFTDAVLVLMGIGTVVFIIRTFEVFVIVGSEPSALVAGFFSFVTAEAAGAGRRRRAGGRTSLFFIDILRKIC